MRKHLLALATAFAIGCGLVSAAHAQEERFWRPPSGNGDGEISLYRQQNYQGAHIRAQTAVPDIGSGWIVRSIRITRGQWQLCTGVNYSGQCSTVSQSAANVILASPQARPRSIRPIVNNPPPGPGGNGASLRGMAAEFYPQPSSRGQRILACARGQATATCARTTAVSFCRSNGYNYVGNVALQTDRGRAYLADVLCKRSAN